VSNINLVIEERAADIAGFLVGRILPFRQKRMVGPFIFIDHMGPVKMNAREHFDVAPHPHIGLSTLTFLFEGNIMHRDSIGTEIEISPGAVNWMTAGKGVVHSERTPDYLRDSTKLMHGLQIWVALPKELEQMEPEFHHIEKKDIPTWEDGEVEITLVAGEVLGKKSPVPVHSKLFMIELRSKSKQTINIGDQLFGESGLYIVEGGIEAEGNTFEAGNMLIAKDSTLCSFTILENSLVYIFGGEPFPETRYIDWNFVSSSQETLDKAREKWKRQEFDKIPGDSDEFVPYPDRVKNLKHKK